MVEEMNWEFYREKSGNLFDDIEEVVWRDGEIFGMRSRAKVQRELPPDFDERATEAIKFWAENYPERDKTVLSLGGHNVYTPRELADHVARRTEPGLMQLEVMRHFAETIKGMIPEEVLRMMRGPAANSESNS